MKSSIAAVAAAAATAALSATLTDASTIPHSDPVQRRDAGGSLRIPLYAHNKRDLRDPEATNKFAKSQLEYVRGKWGNSTVKNTKRQTIGLSDVGDDSFYFGQVSVGTPAQNFNIILDTGSSDFWVVDSSCTSSQCTGVSSFTSGSSSTFQGSTTPFSIQYGSGAVQGVLATDTVSLAGYSVNSQTFAEVDQLASGTLQSPASGIMGMGFQQLATSGATPFWQVLAEQSKLSTNSFTFQLARNSDATSATSVSSGGVFTLGEVDASQYTGTPNYVSLSGTEGYWTIPIQGYNINGQSTTLSTNNVAAIDTGTSLIIMPSTVAASIYQQIPNSEQYGSSSEGTYAIPCTSNVQLSLSFGGQAYTVNSADMLNGALDTSGQYCLGGILGASLGDGAPDYIVGDTFLKNVFSIFRYSPAAVGFASLQGTSSQTAATTSGAVGSVASATAVTTASATSRSSASSSGAATVAPPILSTNSASRSATTAQGGSGLSNPVAASTHAVSSVSLIPAGGAASSSSGSSSGAGIIVPSSYLALTITVLLGFIAYL
ncbi:hypothetical protein CBS101457_000502 [Exobasidium rhododendri]|nr:hypothetical protein CBS101457_000502 [Exobasidium rhododendri]